MVRGLLCISELGGPRGKLFRLVRACVRCVCLVRSGRKREGLRFPFPLFSRQAFPFPSRIPPPPKILSNFSWLYRHLYSNITIVTRNHLNNYYILRSYPLKGAVICIAYSLDPLHHPPYITCKSKKKLSVLVEEVIGFIHFSQNMSF